MHDNKEDDKPNRKEDLGSANREYKDRLFKFIFGNPDNKKWTLSLYNAMNGTNYDDPDDITINTIKDVLYMGMKNDVSFIISFIINFWEQQSSFNPNTPLRILIYAGMVYAAYVEYTKNFNIYSSRLQKIPVPKCVCFYNGTDNKEDRVVLNLSDAFPEGSKPDIDVRVTMININYGHNKELMAACKPLSEYSWLVEEIRKNSKTENVTTEQAVDAALDSMPNDFLIKPFLITNKAEVRRMCITEYDEEKTFAAMRREEREEGRAEGENNKSINIALKLLARGKDSLDEISELTGLNLDKIKELAAGNVSFGV